MRRVAEVFGARMRAWAAKRSQSVTPFGFIGMFAVSVYGGYFNGGLGIILLALFSLWGMTNIHQMNGLKTAMSFILSVISVAIFASAGIIEWKAGLMMMVASTAGGKLVSPSISRKSISIVLHSASIGTSCTYPSKGHSE